MIAQQLTLDEGRLVLAVTIPGPPQWARRHRTRVVNGLAMMHPDPDHARAEMTIAGIATLAWRGRPLLDEPVVVEIETWHARPQRLMRRKDAGDPARAYVGKPDADNVAKLVLDALTWDKKRRTGIWTDDTRVADLVVRRRYLPLDERSVHVGVERTEVRVRTMGGA